MQIELQLEQLREKSRVTNIAIGKSRDEVVRCVREGGEIRIAAALDSNSSPKDTEARCKKLDAQRGAAQSEIDRLMADVMAFDTAVERIEAELLPKRHADRLERQRQTRETYQDVARRILEAANLLTDLSLKARDLFFSATQEFPREERAKDQEIVFLNGGLKEVWDSNWIDRFGNPTLRDVIVGQIFDWDRSLVDDADPVAKMKRHQEEHQRRRYAEIERERRLRNNPSGIDIAESKAAAIARGESVLTTAWPPPLPRLSGSMGNG